MCVVSAAFPSNEWGAFPNERTRTFQRNGATCQIQDRCFFLERSVTLFSYRTMVLPSNIDKS